MSRTIKFRVWDIESKSFVEAKDIAFYNDFKMVGWDFFYTDYREERNIPSEAIIQQFTGLKDKNGKEIYEGDLINFKKQDGVYKYQVGFQEVRFPFVCGNAHLGEVIGNIYENQNLLK